MSSDNVTENSVDISVLGCCVSRDAIAFNESAYKVNRCVQFISMYSISDGEPMGVSPEMFTGFGFRNFATRCLCQDANKNAFSYLGEIKSNWLLLDVASTRNAIFIWPQKNFCITDSYWVQKSMPLLIKICGGSPVKYNSWELKEEILKERVIKFCNNILKFYNPSEIIFNEFYSAKEFLNQNNIITPFSKDLLNKINSYSDLMHRLNKLCEQLLEGCHIIKPLDNILADSSHRWGIDPLHYHSLYYEYMEKAIGIIKQKFKRSEENCEIENLRKLYSEKFTNLRAQAELKKISLDRDKWNNYSHTFKSLIKSGFVNYNGNIQPYIVQSMLTNGYDHIAIYGDTEITKVLLYVLKDTDISIDYVVENAAKPIPGVMTLDRKSDNYPIVSAMFVADIYYFSSIEAKLKKMKVPFPIYNVADYICSFPIEEKSIVRKIKDEVSSLIISDEPFAKHKTELYAQIDVLTKMEWVSKARISELSETVGKLRADNKRLTDANGAIEKQKSETVSRLISDKNKIAAARAQAENDLASLRGSVSFKLGRAITFIPRKIRGLFRGKKKNGEERKK